MLYVQLYVSLWRFLRLKIQFALRTSKYRFQILASLMFVSQFAFGQSDGGSNYLLISLIGLGIVLLVMAVLSLADNLIQIEATKAGVDTKTTNLGIFPSYTSFLNKKAPIYAKGSGFHRFSKGFDIKLVGAPESTDIENIAASRYAIKPTDFLGMSPIPKVVVAEGDEVKAGDPLFFDKKRPEIIYVAPVSGEVVEINRGAKRAITEIVILADKENNYKQITAPSLDAERGELVNFLCENGAWALFNQRPFDMVPARDVVPANIFISTFDTAPLAVDQAIVVAGKEAHFQKGLDVLAKLTSGSVYLGLDGRGSEPVAAFANCTGIVKNYFAGKHPVGNVGVQIHHTAPIKGEEVVWTLGVQEVITLGTVFAEGKYDASRVVTIGGVQIAQPKIVRTYQGANIAELLGENGLNEGDTRLIVGDVLTGKTAETSDYLSFGSDQITAIKEGKYHELFGWLLPLKPRPTISGTYPNFLFPDFKFEGDTNTHGEKRAFVVSGQYESVLPMDIYPTHLMKAIMTGDIERMEGLGINELSEEDIALCEFVCTSKMPLQQLLREGLNMMREQA